MTQGRASLAFGALLLTVVVLSLFTTKAESVRIKDVVVPQLGDQHSTLQQIANLVQTRKVINAGTIGPQLFAKFASVLQSPNSGYPVVVVNITLNGNTLEVTVQTKIWGDPVELFLTLFFTSPQDTLPQGQLEFIISAGSLASVFANIHQSDNETFPIPPWCADLNIVGANVDFILSTADYNGQKEGLTLTAVATLAPSSSSVLLKAFETLRAPADATQVHLDLVVYVPLYSTTDPTAFTLVLTETGTFSLTDHIQCTNYQLNLAGGSPAITLTAQLQVSLQQTQQPLSLALSADWSANSATAVFTGALQSGWNNAFGLDWLTLTTATATLVVGPPGITVQNFTFNGGALVRFSGSSGAPAQITAKVAPGGHYLLSVINIPINGNSLTSVFSSVAHGTSQPAVLSDVSVQGTASFVVATYNTGAVNQGFSLTADVTLTSSGQLFDAARVLQASPSQAHYALSLFVPIFSSAPEDIQLNIKETGNFALGPDVEVNDYQITANVVDDSTTVALQAQVSVATSGSPLVVDISGTYSEQTGSVQFNGALGSAWQQPFGLSWLTVNSATLGLYAQAPATVANVTVTGQATVTFSSTQVDVQTYLSGGTNYLLLISGVPVEALASLYADVVRGGTLPALVSSDLALHGVFGFALASFDSPQARKGLTLDADVTVTSASSVLYKAAQVLQGNPSTSTFTLNLYVPLYGPQPVDDVELKLTENGAFALSQSVAIDSYSLTVDVSQATTVALSTQVSVTPSGQQHPAVFTASATWNEGQADVSFSGALSGVWKNPLGLSWLTISSASVSFVVGSSESVDKVSIDAAASVTFTTSPISADIIVNGNGNARLAVTGIPINNLVLLFVEVTGQAPPDSFAGVKLQQATVSFAVSTYSDSKYQAGLTLDAQATLLDGQLQQAANVLLSSPASAVFDLNLFIPIFSASPENFALSIVESGDFALTQDIHITSVRLTIDGGTNAQIALSTAVSITLSKQNGQPLVFNIAGKWAEGADVSFTGALQGTWSDPFGLNWLAITTASANLVIGVPAEVKSLAIAAAATITLDNQSEHVSVSITTANNFVDVTFIATVDASWSLPGVAQGLLGKDFPVLADISRDSSVSFSVIVSTYVHDNIKSGLTLETKGTIAGGLLGRVHGLTQSQLGDLTFDVSLNIPVFTDPEDVSVTLQIDDQISITPHFFYEGITFGVQALPLEVSVETEFLATFTANPPLKFDVGATIAEDGSAVFNGMMIGTWANVFGFKGFSLSDVIIEFGINPAMCAADFCISDLGMGFKMQLGTKTIAFDGNAAAPDFQDIFLEGSVSGANGMALTMRDVVREWNSIFPSLQIPINDVPQGWGLEDTSFYFAPVDGQFGNIHYYAGFSFKGGIRLLDMDLDFMVNCSDQNWDFCNFAFHIDLNWDLFKQMIKHELDLAIAEREDRIDKETAEALVVFELTDLSLSEWSAQHYAQGVYPRWQIGIDFLNHVHHLDFRVEQYELASSFRDFFKKWLEHVFFGRDAAAGPAQTLTINDQ